VDGRPRRGPRPSLSRAEGVVGQNFGRIDSAEALVWHLLGRACRDRRAPWRTPALATVSAAGGAVARTVVLRSVDRATGRFRLHTDRRSGKAAEIAACPGTSLLFWDPRHALQLRVSGEARLLTEGAEVAAAWAIVPEAARANYRTSLPPGSVLAAPGPAPEAGDGEANFALVDVTAESLDLLWLGPEGHRRAGWQRRADGWAGVWRVP